LAAFEENKRRRKMVHSLVRAGSVEAEAAFAGLLVALDHILLASVANVARRARAPVPIPEGGASCTIFARLLGAVILQLAVRSWNQAHKAFVRKIHMHHSRQIN
jgi:hypothetical protein